MPEQNGDSPGPKPPIRAAVYQGPTDPRHHDRGTNAYESKRMPDGKGFDEHLRDQLERARLSGRNDLTLLDIGSGNGGLFTSFLEMPGLNPLSRGFLAEHPNFKLRMIGLTDSPSNNQHNTEKPMRLRDDLRGIDKRVNEQVKVKNMHWSLTEDQTLARFLEENGVDSLNLVVSTEALRYLNIRVFDEVLETVWQRLAPRGKFIGQGFWGNEPNLDRKGREIALGEKLDSLQAFAREEELELYQFGPSRIPNSFIITKPQGAE